MMGSSEEPERKRRYVSHSNTNNSVSLSAKTKQPAACLPDEKKADTSMLQYKNHKLAQQLEVQKNEIHALETKLCDLKGRQASYDTTLALVHNKWEELVDNLELLSVRANASTNGLKVLQPLQDSTDSDSASVPPEEAFLHRLLGSSATESSNGTNGDTCIEPALKSRQASTIRTMENLVQAIDCQRAKNDELSKSLSKGLSSDDMEELLDKIEEDRRAELIKLRSAIDALHLKHQGLASEVRLYRDSHTQDQVEIRKLRGELEETTAELETSRRKVAALQNQKDAGPSLPVGMPGARIEVGEKSSKEIRELEASLEEAKTLASRRLIELQEVQQERLALSDQLRKMQDSLTDEQHILSTRSYILLNDQVVHLKSEVEHYQSLVEQLQLERDNALNHEKEALMKAEAGEAAQRTNVVSIARISELESKLQQCMTERNDLQIRLELSQTIERTDEVTEFKVMISTLHKEMCMMQQQLDKYKEAALGAHSLRAEVQSLTAMLDRKTNECRSLLKRVADHPVEIKLLRDEMQRLQESEQELKLILDMYGRESFGSREPYELKQSECRAWAQVERLKAALDEHSLELRVKAANEAEAACQQRLAAAEAEIAELRQRLDDSERGMLELKEALKTKSDEGDAYLAEIETIGQAYEDMQTQNQRLLQQISERDDYNIKLVSESVKAKQLQSSLFEEKQLLVNRAQQAISMVECHKQRVTRLEEQAKTYLEQLGKATDESRQYAGALEVAKIKLFDAEKESQSTKSALEVTQKELEQSRQKMAGIQEKLEKERFEKRRMQEDIASLNIKVGRLGVQSEGGSLVDRLQEEIKEYKAVLKCSVCHDRPKEVVITKCYHLFCSPCIQRNLEIRHRKCPGCGVPFGQNDVRNVYI